MPEFSVARTPRSEPPGSRVRSAIGKYGRPRGPASAGCCPKEQRQAYGQLERAVQDSKATPQWKNARQGHVFDRPRWIPRKTAASCDNSIMKARPGKLY